MIGKKIFLQKLTSQQQTMRSLPVTSTNFEGSSPPGVFIGRANYPKVFAGPMLSQEQDSYVYDAPERWLGAFEKEDIINFRLNLLRGKRLMSVHDVAGRFAQQMQDIALSKDSLYTHAEFEKVPRGVTFNEDHQPFGPSAPIKKVETENASWQKDMEKAFYDSDLKAADAVVGLNKKRLEFTSIQKALSVGAFGRARNRKLVPTRWSITATDDILGKNALGDVRENEVIGDYRVYESAGLHNYFAVMLTPTQWQYEAIEAFINVLGKRTFMFSDYEQHFGRQEYSEMGGCYYSQRAMVAEHLQQNNEQAGAFVFREVYEDYVPTGVWVCRELTREALKQEPKTFGTMNEALQYVNSKTRLGVPTLKQNMRLIREIKAQKTLREYC